MKKEPMDKKETIKALPRVIIRRAVPEDKKDVLSFTKDTWEEEGFLEEGDYIQHVWDIWIEDKYGELFVADINNRAVAVLHMRMLPDGSAWLEGLRVHPRYRKMGIGQKINRRAMEIAKKVGLTHVRGAIFKGNEKAVKLAGKLGFTILKPKWKVYEMDYESVKKIWLSGKVREFKGSLDELVKMASEMETFKLGHELMFFFWSWFKLNEDSAKMAFEMLPDLRVMEYNRKIIIFRIKEELGDIVVEFNIVPDSLDAIKATLAHLKFVEGLRFDKVQIPVPVGSKLDEELEVLGIKVRFELLIFEGKL